jgi:hypothetical protein
MSGASMKSRSIEARLQREVGKIMGIRQVEIDLRQAELEVVKREINKAQAKEHERTPQEPTATAA